MRPARWHRRPHAARNGWRRGRHRRTAPIPSGNPSAQPDLAEAFETAEGGAVDQTFRLIVKPDLWGKTARLRLTNVFGTRPVRFDDVFVGLQSSGGNVAAGTNRPCSSHGARPTVTIPAGGAATSDPIDLSFVRSAADPLLAGRKLVVSFHAVGSTGPMTWHAKALTTSYLTAPRSGSHGRDESDAGLLVHDDVLVFPRRHRCRRAGAHGGGRLFRRLDH